MAKDIEGSFYNDHYGPLHSQLYTPLPSPYYTPVPLPQPQYYTMPATFTPHTPSGWTCAKCGRSFAPCVTECKPCNDQIK